jgi:hypothetical protein
MLADDCRRRAALMGVPAAAWRDHYGEIFLRSAAAAAGAVRI